MKWFLSLAILTMALVPAVQADSFPNVLWVPVNDTDGIDLDAPRPPQTIGRGAIAWNRNELEKLQGATAAVGRSDAHVVQLMTATCLPCKQGWANLERELTPLNYRFGPGGHFRQELVASGSVPRYEIRSGGQVLKSFDYRATPSQLANELVLATQATSAPVSYGAITLGSVPAKKELGAFLAFWRPIVSTGGGLDLGYRRDLPELPIVVGGAKLIIPKEAILAWTVQGEGLDLRFSKPVKFEPQGLGPFSASFRINGLTINPESIEGDVPGLPNPRITVTD